MKNATLDVLAVITILSSTPAWPSTSPLQLKPTSAWNVDYADDRCRLFRKFGAGDEESFAIFDRYGPTDRFRLTLAGKPFKTSIGEGEAIVQFGPVESQQMLTFYKGDFDKIPALVFQSQVRLAPPTSTELATMEKARKVEEAFTLAPVGPEREKAIRNLTVSKPLRQTVVLETGAMQKPLAALEKCIDDLMTTWGIDVELHKQLSQPVKPLKSPGEWLGTKDYPVDMWSKGQAAIVEFRLSVASDGKPSSCHIQSTTRPKEFDAAVCDALMKRARFAPALDAEGKPITSFYRNTVRFSP